MLHWSISGASTPTGVATDDFREVVLPLEELEALGFDAVVAGHIHKPQHLTDEIFYVGSPSPVDFGEASSGHGVRLVEIGDAIISSQFLPIESRPFVTVDVDLTTDRHDELGVDETDAVAAAIVTHAPLDDAVVRIRYRATEEQARRIDWPKLRAYLDCAHKVYGVSGEISRSDRVRIVDVDEDLGPRDAIAMWADVQLLDEWQRKSLGELTDLYLEAVQ
jgi:DNA repair exonuclease SbcCD nuclease subunit